VDDRFPTPDAPAFDPAGAAPDAALDDQNQPVLDAGAPPDAAPPEQEQSDPAAELARIRAEAEQTRAQLEAERRAREQYEQQVAAQQRQIAENAARQWAQAEQELQAQLPQMDPDEAVRSTREFYQARERFLLQQQQQVQQQAHAERVAAFAQHVAKEHGLTDQDAQQLLLTPGAYQNPNLLVQAAQTIKQSRESQSAETKRLQQQIDQLTRQMQAQGLKPAWQAGGANVASRASFDPRSPDYDVDAHYAALMRQGRPG
jgi:hypothetical protein